MSMNSKTENPKQLQTENPVQQYYFRALICFAAAGTIASKINWDNPSILRMIFIVLLLTYAYSTYHFTRKYVSDQSLRIIRWLTYVDAGLIGLVLSLTDFSILPCIMFLTMIQETDGRQYCLRCGCHPQFIHSYAPISTFQ
jgi:adenylate cyclase